MTQKRHRLSSQRQSQFQITWSLWYWKEEKKNKQNVSDEKNHANQISISLEMELFLISCIKLINALPYRCIIYFKIHLRYILFNENLLIRRAENIICTQYLDIPNMYTVQYKRELRTIVWFQVEWMERTEHSKFSHGKY